MRLGACRAPCYAAVPTTAFSIPGSGAIESLNVAASVNICQYELARSDWSASQ